MSYEAGRKQVGGVVSVVGGAHSQPSGQHGAHCPGSLSLVLPWGNMGPLLLNLLIFQEEPEI